MRSQVACCRPGSSPILLAVQAERSLTLEQWQGRILFNQLMDGHFCLCPPYWLPESGGLCPGLMYELPGSLRSAWRPSPPPDPTKTSSRGAQSVSAWSPAWPQRHTGTRGFHRKPVGGGGGSESLGSLTGEGVSTPQVRCWALRALVWHNPRPLWGVSWGSGSIICWP